jgi:hypothetical protein
MRWPADTVLTQQVLTVEQRDCAVCGRTLAICDHRFHRLFTLNGPVELVCKLVHCPDHACSAHTRTLSPLSEAQITLPWWIIGWGVFCWIGHRRFARHWSVPQLRAELADTYHITLSEDAIAGALRRYRIMVAARQQDAAVLADVYRDSNALILSIDGLQPEKGHETLYVVRELNAKRVWFAEALVSSAADEVQRLIRKAKEWAAQLGKPVVLWMSDKQEAFVQGIAAEFPGVPHRYCQNHFLRDVAKTVLEQDSHTKVTMRAKVRGLRAIERDVLQNRPNPATTAPVAEACASLPVTPDSADPVVLDYCVAVRGILNSSQGGPLHPPGLRMAEALQDVHASLQRNLGAKKGACGGTVEAIGRLYRTRSGVGGGGATSHPRTRRRDQDDRRDTGPRERNPASTPARVRSVASAFEVPRRRGVSSDGGGDGRVRGWVVWHARA